mmetsp:Transcript_63114/g.162526  ORF Transcript_63114/g.162526 Transcript_63114/m.162526 type:complete len:212 (+) Transcript_63114:494-1129(+)
MWPASDSKASLMSRALRSRGTFVTLIVLQRVMSSSRRGRLTGGPAERLSSTRVRGWRGSGTSIMRRFRTTPLSRSRAASARRGGGPQSSERMPLPRTETGGRVVARSSSYRGRIQLDHRLAGGAPHPSSSSCEILLRRQSALSAPLPLPEDLAPPFQPLLLKLVVFSSSSSSSLPRQSSCSIHGGGVPEPFPALSQPPFSWPLLRPFQPPL